MVKEDEKNFQSKLVLPVIGGRVSTAHKPGLRLAQIRGTSSGLRDGVLARTRTLCMHVALMI